MEYLRNLFRNEQKKLPSKDDVCEEILRVIRAKIQYGSVFKNHYPLEYVLLDDHDPPSILDDRFPRITLHVLRHKTRFDGSKTDSYRLLRDNRNHWAADYEVPGGGGWEPLVSERGVKKLIYLLKLVGEAEVGKTYP